MNRTDKAFFFKYPHPPLIKTTLIETRNVNDDKNIDILKKYILYQSIDKYRYPEIFETETDIFSYEIYLNQLKKKNVKKISMCVSKLAEKRLTKTLIFRYIENRNFLLRANIELAQQKKKKNTITR